MFFDETNHIYIAMPVYNLIEYSDNYWDTSERLWQFKRDKVSVDNPDLTADSSLSFKYKVGLAWKTADTFDNKNSSVKPKKFVRLEYLSNFWRSVEIPLINCKTQ